MNEVMCRGRVRRPAPAVPGPVFGLERDSFAADTYRDMSGAARNFMPTFKNLRFYIDISKAMVYLSKEAG
jgi:hypothetical protein